MVDVLSPENKKLLKARAKNIDPLVRIGKAGLTDNAVMQVRKLLQKRKLVKVKFLRSFLEGNDRKKAAAELAERTASQLIEQVGFVVVLYRR